MKEIAITSNNYIPNIKVIKSHIVTFNDQFIYLYNIEGNLLDTIKIDSENKIINICYINNNFLIGFTCSDLFKINIKDCSLEIDIMQRTDKYLAEIVDVLYLEKNKLLIISYDDYIAIKDINSLNENPIQIINKQCSFLLNINEDLFISFNETSISLYQKIIGTKYYQLLTNKKLTKNLYPYIKRLLKLDNTTLMVLTDKTIYLINIKLMKIYQDFSFSNYPGEIGFIYKIKDNIYVYKDNILLDFKYYQKYITLINSINQNILFSFNYLNNLFIEKKYPHLYNKIKINCIENKITKKSIYFVLNIIESKLNAILNLIKSKEINNLIKIKEPTISYNKEKVKSIKYLIKTNYINEYILKKKIKISKSELRIERIEKKEKIKKRKNEIKKNKTFYYPKHYKKNYR